jgi:p-aminobenzoyl-glutamate transporter AbgT
MDCPQIPWWPNAVTWVLLFFGWLVVHRATLARERRKEKRETANCAVNELREIEKEAFEFHAAESFDDRKGSALRKRVERLINQLQRPPLVALGIPVGRMIALRSSITLNNADLSNFTPQKSDSLILQSICDAVDDLIEEIEASRDKCWT